MRILILGDVMGRPARRAVRELVPALIKEEKIDLAIANAENAAGGMGVDIKSAGELFSAGINVLTSGNIKFAPDIPKRLLDAAARSSGWGSPLPAGVG